VAKPRRRRILLTLGVAPAALYLVAALALYTMQGQLIYPGHRIKIREEPLPAIAGLEAFRIRRLPAGPRRGTSRRWDQRFLQKSGVL